MGGCVCAVVSEGIHKVFLGGDEDDDIDAIVQYSACTYLYPAGRYSRHDSEVGSRKMDRANKQTNKKIFRVSGVFDKLTLIAAHGYVKPKSS